MPQAQCLSRAPGPQGSLEVCRCSHYSLLMRPRMLAGTQAGVDGPNPAVQSSAAAIEARCAPFCRGLCRARQAALSSCSCCWSQPCCPCTSSSSSTLTWLLCSPRVQDVCPPAGGKSGSAGPSPPNHSATAAANGVDEQVRSLTWHYGLPFYQLQCVCRMEGPALFFAQCRHWRAMCDPMLLFTAAVCLCAPSVHPL